MESTALRPAYLDSMVTSVGVAVSATTTPPVITSRGRVPVSQDMLVNCAIMVGDIL